jgi:hypothetical protein
VRVGDGGGVVVDQPNLPGDGRRRQLVVPGDHEHPDAGVLALADRLGRLFSELLINLPVFLFWDLICGRKTFFTFFSYIFTILIIYFLLNNIFGHLGGSTMAQVPRNVSPEVGKFSASRLNWMPGGARNVVSAKPITRQPLSANVW